MMHLCFCRLYNGGNSLNSERSSLSSCHPLCYVYLQKMFGAWLTSEARRAACSWTGMGLRFSKRFSRSWICHLVKKSVSAVSTTANIYLFIMMKYNLIEDYTRAASKT